MTRLQATTPAASSGASPVVFDAIDASYGPIESIPWLGSGGGGEEGRQNMGDTGAILGGRKLSF